MGGSVNLLSKKELCRIFGLYSQMTGTCYYKLLRQKVFTDEALEGMGMTIEDYKKVKVFDSVTSAKIMKYFNIDQSELEE